MKLHNMLLKCFSLYLRKGKAETNVRADKTKTNTSDEARRIVLDWEQKLSTYLLASVFD